MKKLFYLSIFLISFSSCEKAYKCECKQVLNGEDWNPIITYVSIENKKKNAKTECESLSYSFGWQDYKNCTIKE